MTRNKLFAILTVVGVSACLYACGSDGDDDVSPAGGAAGHSAGSGAKAGSGGSAGKAGSGGTAGKGTTGGSGNAAGESAAGEGGTTGAGDLGGAGGDKAVSAAGDTGSGTAGAGGEAGAAVAPEQTLAEACATACGPAHSVSSCSKTLDDCTAQCTNYPDLVATNVPDFTTPEQAATLGVEYLAAMRCIAANVTDTADFACTAQGTMSGISASPKQTSACETTLCKWICDDVTFNVGSGDQNVWTRCCN